MIIANNLTILVIRTPQLNTLTKLRINATLTYTSDSYQLSEYCLSHLLYLTNYQKTLTKRIWLNTMDALETNLYPYPNSTIIKVTNRAKFSTNTEAHANILLGLDSYVFDIE